jgi:hypothetical protein
MKITAFTVIICIFASIGLVRLLQRVARNGMALRSALVWIITWLCLAVFSIFPDLLNEIVAAAGMENRLFFVLIIAVMALAALVFNLTSRIDRMHRDIGLAIRELAIANYRIDILKREQNRAGPSASASFVSSSPGDPPDKSIGDNIAAVGEHPLDHGG